MKILRTLQAVGRGCFGEYLDVPTAKRRYDYGTVREMREQVGGFQCLFEIAFRVPILRCDAAGGGEGAGIREDGRVPGVHGEGVRGGAIPEPGAVEEPDRGLVRRRGEGKEAVPEGVGGGETVGEGVRDSAEAEEREAAVLQPPGEPVRGGELFFVGIELESGGKSGDRADGRGIGGSAARIQEPAHPGRKCAVRDGACGGGHVSDGSDGGARERCVG